MQFGTVPTIAAQPGFKMKMCFRERLQDNCGVKTSIILLFTSPKCLLEGSKKKKKEREKKR